MTTSSIPEDVPLWEHQRDIPYSRGSTAKDIPSLSVFLPEPAAVPAPAIIICPGGGYGFRVDDFEGTNVAEWFAERGWAAFVLKYRIPADGYPHPVPLLDAQRAVRLVRSRAAEWNIDPTQIAIMGFSAGGHLASTLVTHFDAGNATSPDPVERQSCRPDYAVLVYPVITLAPGVTHEGSKARLLGPQPDAALVENLSNERQVTPQTPPTVLVHAADDFMVPIENSRLMLAALEKAGVPCALQEYPSGGHGFGFGPNHDKAPPGWLDRVQAWLGTQGYID
jgi:acetyl esterase/lipase